MTETVQAQNQYKEDVNPDSLHFEFVAQLHMFTRDHFTNNHQPHNSLNKTDFAH